MNATIIIKGRSVGMSYFMQRQTQSCITEWQDDHRLCRIVVNWPGLSYGCIDERQEYICSQVRRDMATKWGPRTPWDCLHEQPCWHSQFNGNTSREVHSHTPAPYEWSSESRYQRFEQLLTAQRCHWLGLDDDVLPF